MRTHQHLANRTKRKCSAIPNAWGRLEDVPNESERFAVSSRRSDELSNAGFSFGYFAGESLVTATCLFPRIGALVVVRTYEHTSWAVCAHSSHWHDRIQSLGLTNHGI